jgi:hypothetical protein
MIGEIIETTSLGFLAESLTLHQPPDLGELVKVNIDGRCYCLGVVCYGTTASPDTGRRAVRRSEEDVVDEGVYRAHPQLARLLQTLFRVVLVGWQDGDRVRQTLPPSPPPLHHTVHVAEAQEVRELTQNLAYFRLLLAARCETPSEQVLAAHIRRMVERRGNDGTWLERAARESAVLLKRDHERLIALLTGIDPE